MSKLVTSAREIPNTPYYVTAKDRYFSGWGRSQGMDNVVILPCENYAEARTVLENTKARPEMKYARILINKPRIREWNTYSLFSKDEAPRWYAEGGFTGNRECAHA